ncbi:hydantoinase/oxoprolinase family protein, partial [Mesorhizobium sp. M00.F.Ca.ET.038.03.1.1]
MKMTGAQVPCGIGTVLNHLGVAMISETDNSGADVIREARCRVGADVGGTFTDVVLQQDDGTLRVHKLLSTPPNYDRAVVAAIDHLLRNGEGDSRSFLEEVVHGTTVATNAVLERRGARTALVTTAGFRDVLELRRLRTPHMYDPFWQKPTPLVERQYRFELNERIRSDGSIVRPFDEDEARALARRLGEADVEAVAVCFLHSHRFPEHERRLGAILRAELPDAVIVLSTDILREQQEYERSATTVVSAYVAPLMSKYLHNISSGLSKIDVEAPLMIMQSSGGITTAADAASRPVYCLESGPAAGVVGALAISGFLSLPNVITFDMGGTTAKASLIENGRVSYEREYEVGSTISASSRLLRGSGELIRIPNIDIAEVGTGGGSLAWIDEGGGLQVGPRSAGSNPGPACYGLGAVDPTITDANVLLGFIPPGPLADGGLSVSAELAGKAMDEIASRLGLSRQEVARGIYDIANAKMMRALRAVSSEKGRDPRDFALLAYGGNGAIHAAALAEELGVSTVVVPPLAGLFSAIGLLFGRAEFHDVRFCEVDAHDPDIYKMNDLCREMREHLLGMIGERSAVAWVFSADMRYSGQNWTLEVDVPIGDSIDSDTVAN